MDKLLSKGRINRGIQKSAVVAVILLLAFIFSLQCSIHIWYVGVPLTDSGVFRYVANVILDGGMPYRDAFDHKGPLLYLINAAGLLISQWRGVWVLELATLFATFSCLYKTACLKSGRLASFAVLLCSSVPLFSYFQCGNLVEEYAMPFIAGSIYIFADYFLHERISRLRLILCGLSFAAVCLLRINMAVVWPVMCVAVLIRCCMTRQFARLGYFIGYFMLGIILLAGPILLWLAVNGAFSAFIEDYFVFNMMYTTEAEHPVKQIFLMFFEEKFTLMAFVVSLLLAAKKRDVFHLFYPVFILLSVYSAAMSGRNLPHYGMIIIPALAYPLAHIASLTERGGREIRGTMLLIALVLLWQHVLPVWFTAVDHGVQAYQTQEEAYAGSRDGKTSRIVRNYTQEDDRIIVCGNWNMIYNLSDRLAASRYSYQSPVGSISPEITEEFQADLEENIPKAIVLPMWYYLEDWMLDFIERHRYSLVWQTDDGYASIYVLEETLNEYMIED